MEYGNNALALTLLGTFLADFWDRDIYRRVEIGRLAAQEGKPYEHARRMIAAYEHMFATKPEATILRALGHFNHPAEPNALSIILPTMNEHTYQKALKSLHHARLILTADPSQPVDCHSLIREHFASEATPEDHAKLYEYYTNQAPYRPETREEMTPLFHAVYHGCRAGFCARSLNDVYRDRICRGDVAISPKYWGILGRTFRCWSTSLTLLGLSRLPVSHRTINPG